MVVQHNLTAMNSNRMLGLTTKTQAKATEKLSSGYKINRAADDAAGLAISEKMRKQIRGLTQASANAQDGVSAVQTAEGALTEVHDMLQRMNELAVKAANGTMSESDRNAVQSEVNQLVTEIDRVAITTKFNETYLLKGTNGGEVGKLKYIAASTNLEGKVDAGNTIWKSAGKDVNQNTGVLKAELTTFVQQDAVDAASITGKVTTMTTSSVNYNTDSLNKIINSTNITGYSFKMTNAGSQAVTYIVVESTYENATSKGKGCASVSEVVGALNALGQYSQSGGSFTKKADDSIDVKAFASLDEMMAAIKADHSADIKTISAAVNTKDQNGANYTNANHGLAETVLSMETFADLNSSVDLSLHVGADSSSDNKIAMNIAMMSARGLGINGLKVDGQSSTNATAAIDTIAAALQKVSNQRSSLGAVQNRLEHTINNLDNIVENTQSAESAIRDTDMATQMVTYSNNQILAQAGQAMLAQSNQANQGVLSLLG